MTTMNNTEFSAVWQVVLTDGSVWVPADSSPDSDGYIYARWTADMFAEKVGGTVRQVFNADGSPMNGAH